MAASRLAGIPNGIKVCRDSERKLHYVRGNISGNRVDTEWPVWHLRLVRKGTFPRCHSWSSCFNLVERGTSSFTRLSFSLDDKGRDERIRRLRSDPLAFPRRQGYSVQTLVVWKPHPLFPAVHLTVLLPRSPRETPLNSTRFLLSTVPDIDCVNKTYTGQTT